MTAGGTGAATRTRVRAVAAALVILAAGGIEAGGQDRGTVISHRDLLLVTGATAAAASLVPLDARIAQGFADSTFHARHPGFTVTSNRASLATETLLMITGGSVYLLARMRKNDGVADVALHTTESVASGAMFIQVVRGVLGRARPYVINETGERRNTDPYDIAPLRGFSSYDYRSFPSMHAMASFAAATALTQEMRVRDTPHRRLIGPALYLGAAMPSLARLYLNEHWTSDIAMGAFLGVLSAQKVVGYSHEHPDNRVDRAFLGPRLDVAMTRGANGWTLALLPR